MSQFIVVTSTSNTITAISQEKNIVVQDTAVRGPQGPQGAAGVAGPQGAAGVGVQGSQGAAGAQGAQGAPGTGSTGPQGSQGDAGPQGATGAAGPQGVAGVAGPQGSQGDAGPQGATGAAGPQGVAGVAGPQGSQGASGAPGADSIIYTFDNLTTDSNPVVGFARLNNNDRSLVTEAYVSKTSNSGANSVPWLNSLVASTNSPNKSIITFGRTNDFAYNYARYYVTGLTDATGYVKLSLTYIDHIGTLNTNGANLLLGASRIGDAGSTGPQGSQGASGGGLPLANGTSNIDIVTINGNVTITANGSQIWTFGDDGNLTFPDSTVQNTAYTGTAATVDITDTNGLTTVYYPIFVENRANGQIVRADVDLSYRTDDNILTVGNVNTGSITFSDNTVQNTAYTGGAALLPLANGNSNIDIPIANGYVTVTANAFTWTFNETNGLLELAGNLANFSACSAINFVANSSGDGAGYSTIELRPDSNATLDQYLIIDPTVLNHIHIRAGGTQDNSNGQIFLGGEYSYFSVGSGLNPSVYITANQRSWSFNNDGTITFPDSSTQTTAYAGTDIITVKKVFETTNALSSATGVVTHDCNNGHIFVHSSISANFTANFTNTTITSNTATAFTLVLNQGATAYVPTAVQIGGQAQTVSWQGGTQPAGNANKKDVVSFSVVNNNGTWITLGQLTSFG